MLVLLSLSGCKRGPNYVLVTGGRADVVTSDVPADDSVEAQIGVEHWVYETRREETYRYRFDAWGGGNALGPSGLLRLEAESGVAPRFSHNQHWYLRGGAAAELERNSANGLSLLELPVVTGGYQLHHPSQDTPWHIEVGPRLGLGLAGVAVAGDERARLGFAPEAGVAGAVLYQFIALELRAFRAFEDPAMDVFQGSLCVGFLFGACLDQRTIVTDFRGVREKSYVLGITVGAGIVHAATR